MNGRVYDPVIARFLSPDPHVQFEARLISYNRYAYVENNPLRYADPSGYFLKGLEKSFRENIRGNPVFTAVVGIIISVVTYGTAAPAVGAGWGAAIAGATSAAVVTAAQGGSFNDVITAAGIAALAAGASYGIGQAIPDPSNLSAYVAKAVAHTVVGGLRSELSGGRFRDGALGALAAQLATPAINQVPGEGGLGKAFRTIIAAAVGGAVSESMGGDFGAGAISAAYMWLFNHEEHRDVVNEQQKFKDYFEEVTGMSVEDSIAIYEAETGKTLTIDQVQKLFTDPAYAKEQLMNDKDLHTKYRSILNSNVPQTASEAAAAGYQKLGFWKSLFHNPFSNSKWVGPHGHMEGVYNSEGSIVSSNKFKGTFNFYGPEQSSAHTDADISPYLKWGN